MQVPIYDIEPAATTAFFTAAKDRSRQHRRWQPSDGALPALYLGHGAPPLIDDPLWSAQLLDWSLSLPKPKAILIVSAHWEDAPLSISATGAHTPLVYDFWGFPQRYYQVAYPTPDASELARSIVASMPDGLHLHQHPARGLDHGAYVPLQVMYPLADIPVIQMSMPTQDPAQLFAIGARLRALRAEGVLVIGSGFLTHHGSMSVGQADLMPYNVDFDAWAADALDRGAIDELFAWTDRAPAARLAHPTPDHFIPLFVTLGAADNPATTVQTTITGGLFGNSKRSFQVL